MHVHIIAKKKIKNRRICGNASGHQRGERNVQNATKKLARRNRFANVKKKKIFFFFFQNHFFFVCVCVCIVVCNEFFFCCCQVVVIFFLTQVSLAHTHTQRDAWTRKKKGTYGIHALFVLLAWLKMMLACCWLRNTVSVVPLLTCCVLNKEGRTSLLTFVIKKKKIFIHFTSPLCFFFSFILKRIFLWQLSGMGGEGGGGVQ